MPHSVKPDSFLVQKLTRVLYSFTCRSHSIKTLRTLFTMTRGCATPYCKRKARNKYCTTCDKKRWRAKYPMKAAFQTLRQNNRRRGIEQGKPKPFTITFQDFEEFCYNTNYMAGKGRSKTSYSIDCIKEELGYVKGNLQKLTVSANSKKEQVRRKTLIYDYRTRTATVV